MLAEVNLNWQCKFFKVVSIYYLNLFKKWWVLSTLFKRKFRWRSYFVVCCRRKSMLQWQCNRAGGLILWYNVMFHPASTIKSVIINCYLIKEDIIIVWWIVCTLQKCSPILYQSSKKWLYFLENLTCVRQNF